MMDNDTFIKNMLAGGLSYGEIATTLGQTREQIKQRVAELRRMGQLDAYDRPIVPRETKIVPKDEPEVTDVTFEVMWKPKKEVRRAPGAPVPLMELKEHHCRWVVSRMMFCGAPKKSARSSYCERHHAMVWQKSSDYGRQPPSRD